MLIPSSKKKKKNILFESYFVAVEILFSCTSFGSSEAFFHYISSVTSPRLMPPPWPLAHGGYPNAEITAYYYYYDIFIGLIIASRLWIAARIDTMEHSKRMKRPLELACSSDQAPDNEKDEVKAAKRPSNEAAAEVEEFLALLERIENAEKCLKGERELYLSNYIAEEEKCSTAMETAADKTSKSASPSWRPSFEWEDFSYGPRVPEKGPQRVPTSESATATRCSASASKENPRGNAGPSGQHANLLAAEGLDLNVESSPELTLSRGLKLFY